MNNYVCLDMRMTAFDFLAGNSILL